MVLSNDLISQFVKSTNDKTSTKTTSTVHGKIKVYNGERYIQLDGSDLLTPIASMTVSAKDGERVTATINNHKVTVTENLTSPATVYNSESGTISGISKNNGQISDFDIVIADKITVEEFNAAVGRIETLEAYDLTVKTQLTATDASIEQLRAKDIIVDNKLTTYAADIETLKTDKLNASTASITYATIDSLDATNADLYNLESTYASFEKTTTADLEAVKASIGKLEAGDISTDVLDARYASITDLDTERARINALKSDVSDIDTLIFGSASGTTIQSSFANAVIAQLGNAQIKSAMIESVSADKLTAGDIITSNVRVVSDDGKLLISDETIQISDDTRVRVQIGKDAADDYSINIWNSDGYLMFYEGGITDRAITEAIIRNDMVHDSANISAHKLNIASLFEVINDSGRTIKSSAIILDSDEQTLDVAFTNLTSQVDGVEQTVASQGTSLSTIQGQISSKVWQQDISTAVDNVEVGGRNLFGFHKSSYARALTTLTTVTTDEDIYGATITINAESAGVLLRMQRLGFDVVDAGNEPFTFSAVMYSSIEDCQVFVDICDDSGIPVNLSTTPQKVSYTGYPTKYCTSDSSYNGFVDIANSTAFPIGTVIYLEKIKIERGTKATDFTVAPEDFEYVTDNLDERTNTLSTKQSTLEQTVDGISVVVSNHTTDISEKAGKSDVVDVEEQVASLKLTVDDFKTEVASKYTTKTETDDINAQVSLNKTTIEQNADDIQLRATSTEVNEAIDAIDVGGRNILLNTATSVVFPETDDFVSYNKTVCYKFSPVVSNDVKEFLLGFKDGKTFTISFDMDCPRVCQDTSLTLSRVGVYTPFLLTHTDGTKAYWYGTHSSNSIKTVRHTIDTFVNNSLIDLTAEEKSFVGRYACYICPDETNHDALYDFFTNPDDYTVSCLGLYVEFRGLTTGGTISNFKMELGNKSTDWTPAPEDLETRVEGTEANILINSDSIESAVARISTNEKSISSLEQTSTSLTTRVIKNESDIVNNNTLAINAQNDANDAKTAAAAAQYNVDNLEIGGRNLALNTANKITHTFTTETGTDSWSSCTDYYRHGILIESGKTYTLSFDYEFDWGDVTKPTTTAGIGPGVGSDNGTNTPGAYTADSFAMVADYWTYGDGGYDSGRFVYSFTNNKETDLYFAFRMARSFHATNIIDLTGVTLTISSFKIEIGNKVSDWTPAPEDMATSNDLASVQSSAELTEERVTTAESLIEQLSDMIAVLITDANGESLMTQTSMGWAFSTGQLQDMVDTTSENLDNLTNEVGDVNSVVNILKQAVDDLGVLNDYVKIGTYEDEPCIELGESDSDFKLIITNTRIMFMEGSGVPAYINNQSLFINKAVIEEELQQGEFIWKARSNGNLGLIWKGANS